MCVVNTFMFQLVWSLASIMGWRSIYLWKNHLFNLRVKRQIVGFYKRYFLLRSIRQPLNFILVFSKEAPRLIIHLADVKFVKNITLIKFFKRKILIGFRKNIDRYSTRRLFYRICHCKIDSSGPLSPVICLLSRYFLFSWGAHQ
jgi:hypothetical protein